ncbi:DUF6597 domain-containing transcriptional factor [Streptomyces sp. NPDC048172]|uniref:DUF6597 domain-containing transcriptional factor n=1 Tax=Streptomyces sp. NPDC048172 TaxID=3365505 RepID=UPI003710FCEA
MCVTRRGTATVRVTVPAALRPWVAHVSAAPLTPRDGLPVTLTHLPDAATVLVFHIDAARRGELVVMGPRTRAGYFAGKDLPLVVRLRFRPGGAQPLLGVEAGALTDRAVPLGELWGAAGDGLAEELASEGTDAARVLARLERALLVRLAGHGPPPGPEHGKLLLSAAAALSPPSGGNAPGRVREVARDLGVSERQLRTLFTRGIGVPPKRFARIERVRAVLARGTEAGGAGAGGADRADRAGGAEGARLAVAAGYYDQSHMAAEFRELIGVTPSAFLAGERPAPHACGAPAR